GMDATGVELAAFNCLLMRVKTARYDVEALRDEIHDVVERLDALKTAARPNAYMRRWYSTTAAKQLLAFRDEAQSDVLRVILSRAARSARRAAHFDLEAPSEPMTEQYWCHKHRRMCRPVESANGFLRRYALDTLARVEEFAELRSDRVARVLDGVLTSPPYPGLIDYHEQHRYAYELLGLQERRELELGKGSTKGALEDY